MPEKLMLGFEQKMPFMQEDVDALKEKKHAKILVPISVIDGKINEGDQISVVMEDKAETILTVQGDVVIKPIGSITMTEAVECGYDSSWSLWESFSIDLCPGIGMRDKVAIIGVKI